MQWQSIIAMSVVVLTLLAFMFVLAKRRKKPTGGCGHDCGCGHDKLGKPPQA